MSVFVGISCGPTLEEKQHRVGIQIELGNAELSRGNLEEAFKAFEKAKSIYPDEPEIYNGLGLVYLYKQRYEQAVVEFLEALRRDPDFSEAHNNLGFTYIQMKRWDEAIKECRITLSDPFYRTPELAYYNLGTALMEKGELIEAVKELHAAVRLQPKFTWALDKYGVALYRLNRNQEAIKQFKRAIEVDPEYIESYLNLGIVYVNLGKTQEAIEQFKLVLEHSEDDELADAARRYLETLE